MESFISFRKHFIGRVATLAGATFFSASLSLALFPIATRWLQASDYGSYALLMSIVTLLSSAIDGGSSLLLPVSYHHASTGERARIFATVAFIAIAGSAIVTVPLVIVALQFGETLPSTHIPSMSMIIAALIIPLRSLVSITITVSSVTSRTGTIALQTIAQAAAFFSATLVSLIWFSFEGTSLLIGAAFGQIAALCLGLTGLRTHGELIALPSREWARRAFRYSMTSSTFGLVDGAHIFAENLFLTTFGGLHAAGINSHARLYYNFTISALGTVGHNIRTKSLQEARDPSSHFESTQRAWTPVHIALSCTAIFFALFGERIVDAITNGKMNAAASYIPIFMLVALLQHSEQPAIAVVYAWGRAGMAVRFQTSFSLIGILALYPATKFFGIFGVATTVLLENLFSKLYLVYLARKVRSVRSQDHVSYSGMILISAALCWNHFAAPGLGARVLWAVASILLIVFIGRRSIGAIIAEIRRLIRA